ncbi:MAG: alpha/beta hydrolase domain-containing protein [Candidatus Binatia bacterium]
MVVVLPLAAALSASPPARAATPTDPVVVDSPMDVLGAMFVPAGQSVEELPNGYVIEEYLISGAANVYTYNEIPVPGNIVPLTADVPYATRILIRRPSDPADFNGTLVVEWLNSTANFDTSPVWHASAEHFTRKGWIWVGVTNSNQSIQHLVGGCLLLGLLPPGTCGTRYASLSMTENGVAFEMMSQIANLLKGTAANNPLFPDYPVDRLYHAGQSQQGGSMVTYATAFHFPVNDGYFVQAAGSARAINFQCPCEETDPEDCVPDPYPACTPTLQGADRRVATDLPVPVFRVHAETDLAFAIGPDTRQTDTPTFRYYETAGTAHITVHKDIESIPEGTLGITDPIYLEETCASPVNTLADGPIFGSYLYNAMWDNMEQLVQSGTVPPTGEPFALDGADQIARDGFGNALGGIRLPQLDVPKAAYGPINTLNPELPPLFAALGNLFCRLAGTVTPFDEATLAELYPDADDFVSQFNAKIDDLVDGHFLLPEDAVKLRLTIQDKDRSKCITGLNKNLAKVTKAHAKLDQSCLKNGAKGKLAEASIEACIAADTKGKVAKAAAKTTAKAGTDCTLAPDFGSTDASTVNTAAAEEEVALTHDVFGPDVDLAIVDASTSPTESKCQLAAAKIVGKCHNATLKEFNRCKKVGLKGGTVHDPLTLEDCMGGDPKGKVAKICATKLAGTINASCPGIDIATLFPGACSEATTLADLEICLTERVTCRTCFALNRADGLDRDCDKLDDGALNNSCRE